MQGIISKKFCRRKEKENRCSPQIYKNQLIMNITEAKNIPLADWLQSIGINPCKRQGNNLWYFSPFRNEEEASFKVNLARNEWYDFGSGKGGNIIDFVMEHQGTDSVLHTLQAIAGKASAISPALFLFARPNLYPVLKI
jgi:hypothetical protein